MWWVDIYKHFIQFIPNTISDAVLKGHVTKLLAPHMGIDGPRGPQSVYTFAACLCWKVQSLNNWKVKNRIGKFSEFKQM